jgi:hypothetical protein
VAGRFDGGLITTEAGGLLEVQPAWVRKESRTRGHAFCCLPALKVAREMERRLRAAPGTTDTRADSITLPEARQQEILKALGVSLPAMHTGAWPTTKDTNALATSTSTENLSQIKKEDPSEVPAVCGTITMTPRAVR